MAYGSVFCCSSACDLFQTLDILECFGTYLRDSYADALLSIGLAESTPLRF